jgi:hypothetical protein
LDAVKMWMSGGHRIRRIERADAHEAHRLAGAGIVAPQGDAALRAAHDRLATCRSAEGVCTGSGAPASSVTRSASIMALSANALPLSRWHQRQWQQCTNSGASVSR